MAKFLLNVFGGGSILVGVLIIAIGLSTASAAGTGVGLYVGSGLLLFGAPLLGFARVIEVLEEISANTRVVVSVEQAAKDSVIRDRCRPYVRVRKPAFSNRRVYECDVSGEKARFHTEPEAIAFVSARLDAPRAGGLPAAMPA